MAVENLKTTALTNADATPRVASAKGEGAPGRVHHLDGYQTASASASVGSTYALARLPTTAKVKRVLFESGAQTAGAFSIGVYYASAGPDEPGDSSLAGTAIDADLFASVVNCASAVAITDVTNESGTYSPDKRDLPLWQAAGLSADPGGKIDIVATVDTTAVTTGTGKLMVQVEFIA